MKVNTLEKKIFNLELLGPPGCGKTTLNQGIRVPSLYSLYDAKWLERIRLSKLQKKRSWRLRWIFPIKFLTRIMSPPRPGFDDFFEFFSRQRDFIDAFEKGCSTIQEEWKRRFLLEFIFRDGSNIEFARRLLPEKAVFFDEEGFVQHFFTFILWDGKINEPIKEYLDNIDAVVYINTPAKIAALRTFARKDGWVSPLNADYSHAIDATLAILRERHVRFIEVDGSLPHNEFLISSQEAIHKLVRDIRFSKMEITEKAYGTVRKLDSRG
jgi:hypothetical protein